MNDKVAAKAGRVRGILAGLGALLLAGLLTPAVAGVSVTLTAPANGATYTAPATVTLIATDTTAPYGFNWSAVPAGSYTLTAVATAVKKSSPNQTAPRPRPPSR